MNPAAVLILSGPPGAGKTTVARLIADGSDARTAHLHTDDFYAAIRNGFIAPWLAESHDQNRTVSTAIAASACAFTAGGYKVIVDGVVGPWFLDVYRGEAARLGQVIDYAVLRPRLADAEARAAGRVDAPLATYPPSIFEAFAELGDLEPHVIDIGARTADDIAALIVQDMSAGRFRL